MSTPNLNVGDGGPAESPDAPGGRKNVRESTVVKITRFEDLEAWKRARKLVLAVYRAAEGAELKADGYLCEQLRRSALTVLGLIAEGFESGDREQFLFALSQARGAAGEIRAQLYVAADLGYISEAEHRVLSALAIDTTHMITHLARRLRHNAGAAASQNQA